MTVSALNVDTAREKNHSGSTAQVITLPGQALTEGAGPLSASCSSCTLNHICQGSQLPALLGERSEPAMDPDHKFGNREHLFQKGDDPEALYIIKCGSVKQYTILEDGREQIVDFYMPGEVVGLDALENGTHNTSAVVMERTTLCIIPLVRLEQHMPGQYYYWLYKLFSLELLRKQHTLALAMKKDAEVKLAGFLIDLSQRFSARGYSSTCFNLSMRRREIGSYLGIATETVSRTFTHFQESGLLQVERSYIRIHNITELERLAEFG